MTKKFEQNCLTDLIPSPILNPKSKIVWRDRSKIAKGMVCRKNTSNQLQVIITLPTLMKEIIQAPLALAGFRILVVDDDEDSRFYITTVLAADGANVTTVDSAAAALEILPQLQPDVFICDIAMPGEDGYSFIRKVRKLAKDRGGQVPAVALTAYADPEDRIRALEAGFEIHLAKPVDPEALVITIANLMNFDHGNHLFKS